MPIDGQPGYDGARTDRSRRERRQQACSTAFHLESRQLLRQSAVRVPGSLLAKDVPGFVAETAGGYGATVDLARTALAENRAAWKDTSAKAEFRVGP